MTDATTAVVFCALLVLLVLVQFIVIGILCGRLRGIKVEKELWLYMTLAVTWIRDRINECREIRASRRQQPNFETSCQNPRQDFTVSLSDSHGNTAGCGNNNRHSKYGYSQETQIQSMAELMKSGQVLREQELKKDALKLATAAAAAATKGGNDKKATVSAAETTVVFTTYDTANETKQNLVTPCDYEMPVSTVNSASKSLKNQNVILSSYDVAKDSTGIDRSQQARKELAAEYYTVDERQLRPQITEHGNKGENEYEQY